MTVLSSTNKAGPWVANGAQRLYPFSFYTLSADSIKVYVDDVLQTSGYEVNVLAGGEGGVVEFKYPPAKGSRLAIIREEPLDQRTDIQNHTAFYPEIVEAGLDKLTMICQQLSEALERCIKIAVTSGQKPEDIISMVLGAKDIALTAAEGAANANASASAAALTVQTIWAEITGNDASAQEALEALKQAFEAVGSIEAAAAAGRESVNDASLAAVEYAQTQIEESKEASVKVLSTTTDSRKQELLALISESLGAEGAVQAAVDAAKEAEANAKASADSIEEATQDAVAAVNAAIGVAEQKRNEATAAATEAREQAQQAGSAAAESYTYIAETLANKNASAASAQEAAQSAASAELAASAAAGAAGEAALTAAAERIAAHNSNSQAHKALFDSVLSLTGGTLTGTIDRKIPAITLNVAPTSGSYTNFATFRDKNGKNIGVFQLSQYAQNSDVLLRIYTMNGDGSEGEKIVLAPGYVDLPATVRIANGIIKTKSVTERLAIYGGTASSNGAYLSLRGNENTGGTAGEFILAAVNAAGSAKKLNGKPDGSLTWLDKDITLGYPNYAAGVSLGNVSSYTATADGWLFAAGRREDKYWNLRVGGVRVFETGGSSWDAGSCIIPLKKGDVVKTYNGRDDATTAFAVDMVFYPNR